MNSAAANLSNLFAIMVLVGWAACLWWDISSDVRRIISGRNVMLITIFAWFLLEALQLPVDLEQFTQAQYNFALFCVAISVAAFLFGYHSAPRNFFGQLNRNLLVLDNRDHIWKIFLIGFAIGIAPLLYFSGFDVTVLVDGFFTSTGRWGRRMARGRYGGFRDALLELQMFQRAVIPLAAVIIVDRYSSVFRRSICTVFYIWSLIRENLTGTRTAVIATILPIMAVIYWQQPPRIQRFLITYCLPALFVLGYYWSAATVVTRQTGEFRWDAADEANYVGNEMFRELLGIIQIIPSRVPYQFGHTYLVQLVNPIPRFLWPNKPKGDAGLFLATVNGEVNEETGEAYLTRSPGLIGEMYMNFGFLGIIGVSFLIGIVIRGWDAMAHLANSRVTVFVVYMAGLGTIFLCGRSINMATFYALIALGVLLAFMPFEAKRPILMARRQPTA